MTPTEAVKMLREALIESREVLAGEVPAEMSYGVVRTIDSALAATAEREETEPRPFGLAVAPTERVVTVRAATAEPSCSPTCCYAKDIHAYEHSTSCPRAAEPATPPIASDLVPRALMATEIGIHVSAICELQAKHADDLRKVAEAVREYCASRRGFTKPEWESDLDAIIAKAVGR